MSDPLADLVSMVAEMPEAPPWGCTCDFCTDLKRWSDNWCPHCAEVVMSPPKWWENLDVCEDCDDVLMQREPRHLARWADDGGRA